MQPTPEEAALTETMGNLSLAAAKLGVTRRVLLDRMARNPVLQTLRADLREEMLDNAEASLRTAVANKKSWAVAYVLKKLGPKYGYGERADLAEYRACIERQQDPPPGESLLTAENAVELDQLIAIAHGSADGTMPPDPPIVQKLDNAATPGQPNGSAVGAAIAEAKGHAACAARLLGVTRTQLMDYIAVRPHLQDVFDDARAELVDHAETVLRVGVAEQTPWALRLALDTLGHRRGYGELLDPAEVQARPNAALGHDPTRLTCEQLTRYIYLLGLAEGRDEAEGHSEPAGVHDLDEAGLSAGPAPSHPGASS